MKKSAQFLVLPSIFAIIAMVGGCSSSNDQETVTRGSRKEATNKKNEPIKRGCSRCGVRKRPTE